MGLFDKFRKKEPDSQRRREEKDGEISTNTMIKILFDRTGIDKREFADVINEKFGEGSVTDVDDSSPAVLNLMIHIDGLDLMCSYMQFPFPKDEMDVEALISFNIYIKEEEKERLAGHQSFCLITQIGAGKSLEGKRRACLVITRLCAAVMEIYGAAGMCCDAAGLLIGRQVYLYHAAIAEREAGNPEYFPSPLWVLVYPARTDDGACVIETCGLKEFGFLELMFYKPSEEWQYSFEKLYMMSMLQITGKEYYRNMDTIAFTEDTVAIFKRSGDKLAVIGV